MDEQEENVQRAGSPIPFFIFTAIIFLPGVIVGFFLYSLFRWGRNRFSVVSSIGGFFAILALVTLSLSLPALIESFSQLDAFSPGPLIATWAAVSSIVGVIGGLTVTLREVNRFKSSPYLTQLEGSWRYKFTYRRTPLQVLSRKKAIASLKSGSLIEPDKAPLGIDTKNDDVVFRHDSEARKHTFITGGTGSGKTITMLSLMFADIIAGKTIVVADFKRSPQLASKLAAMASANGAEFYHFMSGDVEDYDIPLSKGQCYYDPLKSGTPTSKADMVLGMREYDTNAAVFKAAMQQLLQVVFGMLKFADKSHAQSIDWTHGGIHQLASVISGNGLLELAQACSIEMPSGSTKWTYAKPGAGGIAGAQEINVNSPIAKNAIELIEAMRSKNPLTQAKDELQGQMRTIIASEYGQWMKTGVNPEDREIDLFELTRRGKNVILFSLNSDSEPDFAKYVGSMIFADLTNISALRRNAASTNQVNIYADEFQAVPPTAVTSLLEKSRESKMALTIAQQSFDQVIASASHAGEAYLNSILDTCSNFIAHAGATEDSATRLAKILGKEPVTIYSKTNDNDSSWWRFNGAKSRNSKVGSREDYRWRYEPTEFMSLLSPDPANGFMSTAVWVTKTSADPKHAKKGGGTARTVWVIPPEDVLIDKYASKPIEELRKVEALETPKPADLAIKVNDELPQPESPPEDDRTFYADEAPEEEEDWSMELLAEALPDEGITTMPELEAPEIDSAKQSEPADSDALDALFRSTPPAPVTLSKQLVERPSPERKLPSKNAAAPALKPEASPKRGLPTSRPKPVSSEALPDINSLELPEL